MPTVSSRRVPPAPANRNTPHTPALAARTPASLPPNPWADVQPVERKPIKGVIASRPLPSPDPDAYAMTLRGDCLHPEVLDGSVAIVSPLAPLVPLQFVALFFKAPRMPLFKRLVALPPDSILRAMTAAQPGSNVLGVVLAEMLNPPRLLQFRLSDLAAIHAVVEVIPPDQVQARRTLASGAGDRIAAGVTS